MQKEKKKQKRNSYLGKKIPLAYASRRLLIPSGGAAKDSYVSRELAQIFAR